MILYLTHKLNILLSRMQQARILNKLKFLLYMSDKFKIIIKKKN